MKGYAILFIVLHNFCHFQTFELPQENEMSFSVEKLNLFLEHIRQYPSMVFYDFFSFIGWCGVPLFVFLSGYGLSMKYGIRNTEYGIRKLRIWNYFKYHWLKLFLMALPGTCFFMVLWIGQGNLLRITRTPLALVFLNNLVYGIGGSFSSSIAPPYWYLGMTLQLYMWYLLVRTWKMPMIVSLIALPIFLMSLLNPSFVSPVWLHWFRVNSIGWLPVFVSGIIYARFQPKGDNPIWVLGLAFLIGLVGVIAANANYYVWLLLPFFAVVMFLSISMLTVRFSLISKRMQQIGHYSMYLFLAHPIALIFSEITMPPIGALKISIYLVMSFVLAYIYKFAHRKLVEVIPNSID